MTEEIISRYLAVWSEPDTERRRDAIASLWAEDGVEIVESTPFRGHKELEGRIVEAYEQFVATGAYTVASAGDAAGRDEFATFTLQLIAENGAVAWAARVLLILGEDGRIRYDYQFTVRELAA